MSACVCVCVCVRVRGWELNLGYRSGRSLGESKEAGEVAEPKPEGQRHERERGRRKCVGSNSNNYLTHAE